MVLIIGTLPQVAGVGGVTIHIQRLLENLDIRRIPYNFCDYKKVGIIKVILSVLCNSVVHVHVSNPYFRFLLIMFCRTCGKRVIFTVHGNLGRFNKFKNYLDKLSIQYANIPILINQQSYIKAIEWNTSSVLMSAFIPPNSSLALPDMVLQTIIKAKDEQKMIIVTNASALSYMHDGQEVYGINHLISFFKEKNQYLLCVSDPSGQYSQTFKDSVFENILFITGFHSFYSLMKLSDVMIRATATDGDSLSVREALHLGIKVLATDCVDRPDGVILFKYNDAESLKVALDSKMQRITSSSIDTVDNLVCIYNSLK